MRNLLLIVAVLFGLWLYQRSLPPPPPPPRVVVEPAPTPRLQLYFHSALDAPPMSTSASTGTGYYSTTSDSSFGAGARLGASPAGDRQR